MAGIVPPVNLTLVLSFTRAVPALVVNVPPQELLVTALFNLICAGVVGKMSVNVTPV